MSQNQQPENPRKRKPSAPQYPFEFFCKERLPEYMKKYGSEVVGEKAIVGKMYEDWENLSKDEQSVYEQKAEEKKNNRYKKKKREYWETMCENPTLQNQMLQIPSVPTTSKLPSYSNKCQKRMNEKEREILRKFGIPIMDPSLEPVKTQNPESVENRNPEYQDYGAQLDYGHPENIENQNPLFYENQKPEYQEDSEAHLNPEYHQNPEFFDANFGNQQDFGYQDLEYTEEHFYQNQEFDAMIFENSSEEVMSSSEFGNFLDEMNEEVQDEEGYQGSPYSDEYPNSQISENWLEGTPEPESAMVQEANFDQAQRRAPAKPKCRRNPANINKPKPPNGFACWIADIRERERMKGSGVRPCMNKVWNGRWKELSEEVRKQYTNMDRDRWQREMSDFAKNQKSLESAEPSQDSMTTPEFPTIDYSIPGPAPPPMTAQPPTNSKKRNPAPRIPKQRNPLEPRKPMNAFFLFVTKWRAENSEMTQGMPFKQLSFHLGLVWKNMSVEEKKPYYDEATQKMEAFKKEHPNILKEKAQRCKLKKAEAKRRVLLEQDSNYMQNVSIKEVDGKRINNPAMIPMYGLDPTLPQVNSGHLQYPGTFLGLQNPCPNPCQDIQNTVASDVAMDAPESEIPAPQLPEPIIYKEPFAEFDYLNFKMELDNIEPTIFLPADYPIEKIDF